VKVRFPRTARETAVEDATARSGESSADLGILPAPAFSEVQAG
jgi:hypothetical protein